MNWLSELFYSPEQKQTIAQTDQLRQMMEQQGEIHPLTMARQQAMLEALQRQEAQAQLVQPYETMKTAAGTGASPFQLIQQQPFEQAYRTLHGGEWNPAAAMKIGANMQPDALQQRMSMGQGRGELGAKSEFGSTPRQLVDAQGQIQRDVANIQRGQGSSGLAAELSDIFDDVQKQMALWQGYASGVGGKNLQAAIDDPDADENTLNRLEWEVKQQLQRAKGSQDTRLALMPPGTSPQQITQAYAPLIGDITMHIQRIQQRREQLLSRMQEGMSYPSQPLAPEEYQLLLNP